MKRVDLVVLFILFAISASTTQLRLAENDTCGEGEEKGTCKLFEDCSIAGQLVRNKKRPALCGFKGNSPIICCPYREHFISNDTQHNVKYSTSQQKCEEYAQSVYEVIESVVQIQGAPQENISHCAWNAEELIVGGEVAKPKVFPHMALIGFGTKKEWGCGGSLISTRFILSAAHCNRDKYRQLATWVRLGELDLMSENEEADPKDFRIVERFVHPNYSTRYSYNDIILFKLDSEVVFSPYIRPICLQSTLEINTAGIRPIVTGWGLLSFEGKPSSELMQVKVDLVDSFKCKNIYGQPPLSKSPLIPDGINEKFQLCAGGVVGEDSCSGDSGGPLQIPLKKPFCMFSQIGIVSFGARCAISIPGVYTRVSHYLAWIESIVWL